MTYPEFHKIYQCKIGFSSGPDKPLQNIVCDIKDRLWFICWFNTWKALCSDLFFLTSDQAIDLWPLALKNGLLYQDMNEQKTLNGNGWKSAFQNQQESENTNEKLL